ncbi:hypothetical protein J7T55_010529 [Diaporthe amygdali]|uniref:uncharacterized protein n=1 Tax=Phomopsis amygdali TaxID=1214568 RepID=UPI0022FDE4B0|nr:uncharacterized protein J7T55_010529 [Diaporthe amygdali]KAJ0115706.1 hypothetical protein J7T55_010529 [Diaporthe amygdali]
MAMSGGFASIPKEIRDKIVESLFSNCRQDHSRTAAYASVCREWQAFFEPKHFADLFLTPSRVEAFERFVVGEKRKMVNHINLDVGLWSPSWERDSATENAEDDNLLHVIGTLFNSLSTWDKVKDVNPQRLFLEVSGPFRPSLYRCHQSTDLTSLPKMNTITTLVLQRNFCFQSRPDHLRLLLRSLPALKKLVYQQPEPPGREGNAEHDQCYEFIFGQGLPASLTELSIFEKPIDGFSPLSIIQGPGYAPRDNISSLGLSLAKASRQLEHLSASFAIDARHFLRPFWPQESTDNAEIDAFWTWNKLETLALTSQLLAFPKRSSEEEINCLLEAASVAVRRMPKLLTLELWCGNGNEHGCLFRYTHDPISRSASLTWQGTWTVDITWRVARSWSETVYQKTGSGAEIQFEKMAFAAPRITEAVSVFLLLRDRVGTPMSSWERWSRLD